MIELNSAVYRRTAFALAFGSFLVFCNLYLLQPMLPVFAESYGVSAAKANWLVASTTLGLSLSLVPWAVASERFGRRPVMLTSLFLLPIVGFLSVYSQGFWSLVFLRALMGVSLAGYAAVAVAYMAEEFSPKALVIAVGGYISANSLGGILGRITGGMLSESFGWKGALIAMAVFSVFGALLVASLLPKQQHFPALKTYLASHSSGVIRHLRHTEIWLAMLIGGINFALFVNMYSVMTFRLVAAPYNLPVGLASMIFLCYLAGTLSSKLSGRWAHQHLVSKGMVMGTVFTAFGVALSSLDSIEAIVIGLLVISGGAFFTHSLAYGWVSRKAESAKATATALYLVHYYIGGSLGGFYLIGCWQYGGWPFVALAAFSLVGIMLVLIYLLAKIEKPRENLAGAL